MPIPTPEPGLVISYSFLWSDEAALGRAEGRKTRPCAIVLAVRPDPAEGGATRVYVAPITHRIPQEPIAAIELPRAIKQHLRLDEERSWIIVSELNAFAWPGYDLRPIPASPGDYAYGILPPRFFAEVIERFTALHKQRRLRATPR